MKPETPTKRYLTDVDRDQVLKLIGCGLSTTDIVEIMHISRSTVSYIRQAHTACIEKDWSTLQKLSTCVKPTVEWAMRITGTDKVFLEEFPKDDPEEIAKHEIDHTPNVIPETISREDFLAMYATMQDVRSLLMEIRDVLNEIK